MMAVRVGIVVGVLLVSIGLGILFYGKFAEIASYKAEIAELETQQTRVQSEIDEFERLLSLKDDYAYIEYLARKELGLIYPGEEKYIIVGEIE